jgi:hypothetical protein
MDDYQHHYPSCLGLFAVQVSAIIHLVGHVASVGAEKRSILAISMSSCQHLYEFGSEFRIRKLCGV